MNSKLLKNQSQGLVFNIQQFSVHDGPGIRTTVFMKGCPLRCLWCSNPESQDFSPNLIVRDILCKGCGACAEVCPQSAITITRESGRKINRSQCNQCLLCVPVCIYQSLNSCGKYMEVDEVLREVLKDRLFFKNSGGGVTLSGGEVLLQGRFVRNLLVQCRSEGLHTALDTSGYGSWKELEALLPFVDLLLFDLKHLDSNAHKRATAVDNERILKNLKRASRMVPVWLRIPLIAGFNDSKEHIKKIALVGKEVKAEKISFLPYHEGGKSKSEQLGRTYPMPDAQAPSEEQVQIIKGLVEEKGIKVSIGN